MLSLILTLIIFGELYVNLNTDFNIFAALYVKLNTDFYNCW